MLKIHDAFHGWFIETVFLIKRAQLVIFSYERTVFCGELYADLADTFVFATHSTIAATAATIPLCKGIGCSNRNKIFIEGFNKVGDRGKNTVREFECHGMCPPIKVYFEKSGTLICSLNEVLPKMNAFKKMVKIHVVFHG